MNNDPNDIRKKIMTKSHSIAAQSMFETQEEVNHFMNNPHEVSLERAWKHFRNTTLPRRINDGKGQYSWRKLETGEKGGKLYGIWETKLKELGDFGLGIGLFFHMDMVMCGSLFLAGLINIYTLMYYKSSTYSSDQPDLDWLLDGSAACNFSTVCITADCTSDDVSYITTECELTLVQGILDFITILMLILVVFLLGKYQRKLAEMIDLDAQTAQDYAIVVEDPDPDATNPEEWRRFFSEFGKVTYVTLALNNGDLLRALAARRICMFRIEIEAGGPTSEYHRALDTTVPMTREKPLPPIRKFLQKYFGRSVDVVFWHQKLCYYDQEVKKLLHQNLSACKVYVIFETEQAQRACLNALTTGLIPATLETSSKISAKHRFRGHNVLKISEPAEPAEIIWENQDKNFFFRIKEQTVTLIISALIVALSALAVWWTSTVNEAFAAIFISVSNTILPVICKVITSMEHHPTDSDMQSSLLLKIVMVQWVNTAFIIYLIQPSDEILSDSFIGQVSSILWADAITSPVLLILDIPGRLNRYVFSRFALNQLKMNSYFIGTSWFLAERYASMLKTIFVALFFSAIFPAGYFIGALALFINYWVNKFCILRIWRTPPPMGDFLAVLARGYLQLAVLIKLIMTSNFYSHWLANNMLCIMDGVTVTSVDDSVSELGIQIGDPVYQSCYSEDVSDNPWNFATTDWMSLDQQHLTKLYGIAGIILTVVIGLFLFGQTLWMFVYRLFNGAYTPVGEAQKQPFSEVNEIQTYVPQVELEIYPHPLLATDLSKMKTEHISWQDEYERFNLCSADDLPHMTHDQRVKMFSACVYFDGSHHVDL